MSDFERNRKFQQSCLKLYWAKMHAHHLSVLWEAIVERHYDAATGGDAKLDYSLDNHLLAPPFPPEIPLLIGDAIRNLRSALDYLVSEMARQSGLDDSHIVFPFSRDENGLKACFNEPVPTSEHRKGRKAGAFYELSRKYPNLETIILKDIRACEDTDGSNPFGNLLWSVITSDNVDKHLVCLEKIGPILKRAREGIEALGIGGPDPALVSDLPGPDRGPAKS